MEFRFEPTGKVFVFSEEHDAYVFAGNLNGRSTAQFIRDYKESEDEDNR